MKATLFIPEIKFLIILNMHQSAIIYLIKITYLLVFSQCEKYI